MKNRKIKRINKGKIRKNSNRKTFKAEGSSGEKDGHQSRSAARQER